MKQLNHYFKRFEFACPCGCAGDTVDAELLQIVTKVREHFDQAVTINSGFRCAEHNARVGGSKNSLHLIGKAADIRVKGVNQDLVANYLEGEFPDKYGIGRYNGRTHIDVRQRKARWDNRN